LLPCFLIAATQSPLSDSSTHNHREDLGLRPVDRWGQSFKQPLPLWCKRKAARRLIPIGDPLENFPPHRRAARIPCALFACAAMWVSALPCGMGTYAAVVGVAYVRMSRWLSISQVCCMREAGRVVGFDRGLVDAIRPMWQFPLHGVQDFVDVFPCGARG
jgi:hypothetical protein